MKGASRWDPVAVLDLPRQLVTYIGCPYMVKPAPGRSRAGRYEPCGAQATLYKYPDPYGFRSYCEEGHACVLSQYSIPGIVPQRKGPTD